MPDPKVPRCARKIAFPADSVTSCSDAPTPGPSRTQSRLKSLADNLKAVRASKAQDALNRAKLTSDQRNRSAELKEKKQVVCFLMPDSPEFKKGKGQGKMSDSRISIPCPLLPGVPAVPPPKKPQPWEVRSYEDTVKESDDVVIDVTPPKIAKNRSSVNKSKRKINFSPSSVIKTEAVLAAEDTSVSKLVTEDTVKESDDVVMDVTPPKLANNRSSVNKSKRKINLSPSSGAIHATDPPVNPVWVGNELVVYTTESSTSGTVPGSGSSAMSYDTERELAEPDNNGSENEVQFNSVDSTAPTRNIFDYPAALDDLDDPDLAEDVQSLGAGEDAALRAMADSDDRELLFFDWRGDPNNFEGVREIFTGPSGPTFAAKGLTPLQTLQKIWDTDIIDLIVKETNRYAHQMQLKTATKTNSRMTRWTDTTAEEIWKFFAIMLLQSIVQNNVEREYWYPKIEQLKIGSFDKIMPFNRFLLLKRCLHFVDNAVFPGKPSKLDKILPVITFLNNKFSTLYLPEQNVAIDESLLLWKGRLSFAQLIATKRARVGIKSYELCESRTGYLWRMEIYSGKEDVLEPQEAIEGHEQDNEPESATSKIVYNLMRPLFGKGYTVVMDNFYNAPLLSRLLKKNHNTDTMGTLRLNREFVPESLKDKNKKNMRTGEVCFSSTKDLSVVVWKDKSVVAMLSTFHKLEVGGKEKYGYYKYKPKVVLDYNLFMGGVDHKDQMLQAFPVERVRNVCWYKKLFRRLLNVSVHNAMVIYNHDRTKKKVLGNRNFRLQLVQEMLQVYNPTETLSRRETPPLLSELHLPVKNLKCQRCKLCHAAKIRRTTAWRCSTCNVNLCIAGCYTEYHVEYVCRK